MSTPEANYMWGNVDKTIQIIESQIDLINRKTDLYDPKFCSQDNDGCSQKSSHIIGKFMPMKKQNYIQSRFKSQCTTINERFSKLLGCGILIFTSIKNITLKKDHIIYPMKNKDLCDYDPRCIMSSSLMFDDIIMGAIERNELSHYTAEKDCVLHRLFLTSFICTGGHFKIFYWKKGNYECLEMPCENFYFKNNEMKDYWTQLLS